MSDRAEERFEQLLRQALTPIEPPEDLELRLEATFGTVLEAAAEELDAWEMRALADPRNWPRAALGPTAAVVGGGAAAVGLVLLRTRRKRGRRRAIARDPLDLAERTLRDLAHEANKLVEEARRRR